MKALAPALEAHLKSGVTTLAWCWRLTRRDGTVLGFTDHDRDLVFDGTVFEAAAGLEAGEMAESIGLSVDNIEIGGGITSERLAEDDLASGLYDDAKVELFRVNWVSPAQRVLMRAGSLGEVKRSGRAFSVEVRGLSHYLQQPKGRLFQYTCDTDLGGAKCGVDLGAAAYRATGTIAEVVRPQHVRVVLSGTYEAGWFARGFARVTSGAASGFSVEVRTHEVAEAGGVTMTLWAAPVAGLAAGDEFTVTAGCDKHFKTCRDRFANAVNFRGFPHMPGIDFVTAPARRNKA